MTAPINHATVREFLTTIAAQAKAALADVENPGYLQISRVHPADNKLVVVGRYQFDDVELMVKHAIATAETGHNVYIEGRTVSERVRGKDRGKLEDTVAVVALVVDNDADKEKVWQPNGVMPSMTVETSPGNRQNWFFPDKAIRVGVASKLGERMRAATGTDQDTGVPTQPYRIAGTPNYPNKAKIQRGRSPIPTATSILEIDPKRLWTLRAFAKAFPRPKRAAPGTSNGGGGVGDAPDEAAVPADTMRVIRDGPSASADNQDRSQTFWNVMIALKRLGFTVDGVVGLLERYPDGIALKYEGRVRQQVEHCYNKIRVQPRPQQATPTFDPWQRWIVPDFPLEVLPRGLQEYVSEQSILIGCDHATMAMCALTGVSGAIHHQFAVKMMRNGDWFEHPRLWTLLVGPASYRKTPPINAVTKPIEDIQAASQKKFAAAMAEYKGLSKNEKKTADEPKPPPRWLSTDATPEKMAELLARSTKGIFYKRDEFSGFIGSLDKYGGKSGSNADRAFFLKAYDGGSYTRDRVGDRNPVNSEIFVENLSISMLGGIQPDKMAEMKGLTSDGLLQRFIPVMMRAPGLPQDVPGNAQEHFNTLINALVKLQPKVLSFSDEALAVMAVLRARLHELQQASEGMAVGFPSFVGKLAGIAGRLTVILHVVKHVGADIPGRIEADVAKAIQTLVLDFILPHAIEFYQSAEGAGGGERLRTIASVFLTSGKTTLTARDLIQRVRPLRGLGVRDIQDAVSPFVAGGWLEPVSFLPNNRAWNVTPAVATQFEQQRQTEMARKATLAALLRRSHGK